MVNGLTANLEGGAQPSPAASLGWPYKRIVIDKSQVIRRLRRSLKASTYSVVDLRIHEVCE